MWPPRRSCEPDRALEVDRGRPAGGRRGWCASASRRTTSASHQPSPWADDGEAAAVDGDRVARSRRRRAPSWPRCGPGRRRRRRPRPAPRRCPVNMPASPRGGCRSTRMSSPRRVDAADAARARRRPWWRLRRRRTTRRASSPPNRAGRQVERRSGRRGRPGGRRRPPSAPPSTSTCSDAAARRARRARRRGRRSARGTGGPWRRAAPGRARPAAGRGPSTWRTVSVGVVGPDGARADEDGVALGPQAVGVGPGRLAGDPPARAVGGRGAAVEGGGQLEHDVGPAGACGA